MSERLMIQGEYRRDGWGFSHRYREPGPADLLAAVREAVESGSIKGEVRTVLAKRADNLTPNAIYGIGPGSYLVIPIPESKETG